VGTAISDHVAKLIEEPELRDLFISFLAHQVQHPGVKIRWAVLLQGTYGCGKGFIAEVMQHALGHSNVHLQDASILMSSQYNPWARDHPLVGWDAVPVGGPSRHQVMNKLKPVITNAFVTTNEKYRGEVTVPNLANYLLFTHNEDALSVPEDERRW